MSEPSEKPEPEQEHPDAEAPAEAPADKANRSTNTPMAMLAVSFKEAALDSPTFRASMNHLGEQFEALDRWIDGFIKATTRMTQEMEVLQDAANFLISRFVPDFVTQGLIDHDYTMLAMRRYAGATKHFWTEIISRVNFQSNRTIARLTEFQKADLRSFKECRKNFEATQAKFDAALNRYASMSKTKEPSSLREDAFQVSESRKAYIKASFDMCCIIATVQRALDTSLVEALADPWVLRSRSIGSSDPVFQRIGVEMHRLKTWAKVMSNSMRPIEIEMLRARKEMEDAAVGRAIPSRELNDYTVQTSTISHFVPDAEPDLPDNEKHGWLFVKSSVKPARQVWVRRWVFVKNGMFGWLVLSPNKNSVQESDKIGVLLCNVSPEPSEDRRFCFEIRTKDSTLILQAETLADLRSWLQVFEFSKRQVIQNDTKKSDISYAFQTVYPLIPEFASTAHTSSDMEITHLRNGADANIVGTSPSSPRQSTDLNRIMHSLIATPEATSIQSIMINGKSDFPEAFDFEKTASTFTSIGPFPAHLAPSPLVNAPMPTALTKDAILSSSCLTPTRVPNAATANFWGSVNWALYLKTEQLRGVNNASNAEESPFSVVQKVVEGYPDYYPAELRAQDTQMRAIFQSVVDNDPMDRVVLVVRALVAPNPKQELPARIFVTPRNCYIYSHIFGFTAVVKKPYSEWLSCEGHAGTSWDTIYWVDKDGSSVSARVFLDSGRIIQKRMQYLMDILDNKEVTLKDIVDKMRCLGMPPKAIDNGEFSGSDGGMATRENDTRQLLHDYLSIRRPKTIRAITSRSQMQSSTMIDLALTMDQKVAERTFDISAKTLFYVTFGDLSPVFHYAESSLYRRTNLEISPWKLIKRSGKLERDLSFNLEAKGVFPQSPNTPSKYNNSKVVNVQRVEKMDDSGFYSVYDRRSPWELPHGDVFYTTTRFVITQAGKGRSKMTIYATVEWVERSRMMRMVVENLVYHHMAIEYKILLNRVAQCREKLGKRGMAVTAVRLFGRLGKLAVPEEEETETAAASESNEPDEREKLFAYSFHSSLFGCIVTVITSIVMLVVKTVKNMYKEMTLHKFTVGLLVASVGLNLLLTGMTSVSFWTERRASSVMANKLHVIPGQSSVMKRSIYLSDIDELIRSGHLMDSIETNGLCYDKFKSLVQPPILDNLELPLSIGAIGSLDRESQEYSRRITRYRNELGVRRNRLLISLRMLNRIEQELMITEWKNFLLHEINICSRLTDENVDKRNQSVLKAYCESCMEEWKHSSDIVV
ncbi:membrane-anchored lipid-binding protein Sip3p [Trichomonascus vanleenenianus]|uniref:SIP3 family protein n=1 Tax=Trichomonascus vanleenenianus TaxID=2268995 RepID=UPI003EC9B6EA